MIRLGYVAIATCLDITSSKTITLTEFNKFKDFEKLDKIIKENLGSLDKIIDYGQQDLILKNFKLCFY